MVYYHQEKALVALSASISNFLKFRKMCEMTLHQYHLLQSRVHLGGPGKGTVHQWCEMNQPFHFRNKATVLHAPRSANSFCFFVKSLGIS